MAEGSSPILTNKNSISSTTTVFDSSYWLEKRPLLSVVCSVIRTNRWHQLGIQLNVDETSLNEIDRDNPSTGLKRTKMFEEWLKTQPNATNRQLLNALRLKVIGEDTMAEEYEDRIKKEPTVMLLTERQSTNDTDVVVTSMTQKVLEVRVLTIRARQLQEKYYKLLELIQHLATQYSNVELIKNKLKSILKTNSINQCLGLYCTQINTITTVDEAFTFLVDNNFVGYLNFQLLEYLSSERICGKEGNKEMEDKLSEYKQIYDKFIEEPSFSEVIQVFDENPHLNPSTIIGLPIIVVTLTMEWKKRSKKDLEEWLPFLKENQVLLQSMGYKCILITYAVFPIDLLNIMDFLNDPNNIKTLKDNGISIETPSHTLEIEKLLREDERNTLLVSTDQFLLPHLLEDVSSFRKQVEEQRIADNSHWITQVTLLKASHLINLEEQFRKQEEQFQKQEERFRNQEERFQKQEEQFQKQEEQFQKQEERFRNQEERFQKALSDNNQKMNDLTNELDKAMSTIQMKDKIQMRRTRTRKSLEMKLDLERLSTKLEASFKDSFNSDSGFNTTPFNSRTSTISL